MYQMSHGQIGYSLGSQLEQIASSYSSGIAYSASAVQTSSCSTHFVSINPGVSQSAQSISQYSEPIIQTNYNQNQANYMFTPQNEYLFQPDNFLKPGMGTKFIGKAEDIRGFVEETYEKIFSKPFPDIKVSVLDEKEFRKVAPGHGAVGMSINRVGSLSEVFVLQDTLGKVMLTIGHELGHVLTRTLNNPIGEEAKAYAFSLVWMEVIKENNIADLGNAFVTELPAINGLHDVAYNFVKTIIEKGKSCQDLYREIISRIISVVP